MAIYPNIIVVIIDALRANALSPWGGRPDHAPFLNAFCESGHLFLNTHSPVGWTLPACASIVTGMTPNHHGLIHHKSNFKTPSIGELLPSIYKKIAVTNNRNLLNAPPPENDRTRWSPNLKKEREWCCFDWDKGFDRYDWFDNINHTQAIMRARTHLDQLSRERSPYFFLFHTNVVHDYFYIEPYHTQVQWLLNGHNLDPHLVVFEDSYKIWSDYIIRQSNWPDLTQQIYAKYIGGLFHIDMILEEMLANVNYDTTYVILVSDHGEGFDPENFRVHHCGRLHEDLLHVPLMIKGPGITPQTDHFPRSTTDIVPTILALATGDTPSTHNFDGISLMEKIPKNRTHLLMDYAWLYYPGLQKRLSCWDEQIFTCGLLRENIKKVYMRHNDQVSTFCYDLSTHSRELDGPAQTTLNQHPDLGTVVTTLSPHTLTIDTSYTPMAHSL